MPSRKTPARKQAQRAQAGDVTMVLASGEIDASVEVVHRALTDPALLTRWWASAGTCGITHATIDATRGGSYRIESRTRYGTPHFISGEVIHLAPRAIAFTWTTDETPGSVSVVYLALASLRSRCRLSVEHAEIATEVEQARMADGWPRILAVMQRGIPRLVGDRTPADVRAFLARHDIVAGEG